MLSQSFYMSVVEFIDKGGGCDTRDEEDEPEAAGALAG